LSGSALREIQKLMGKSWKMRIDEEPETNAFSVQVNESEKRTEDTYKRIENAFVHIPMKELVTMNGYYTMEVHTLFLSQQSRFHVFVFLIQMLFMGLEVIRCILSKCAFAFQCWWREWLFLNFLSMCNVRLTVLKSILLVSKESKARVEPKAA
jgi:hypothetical protein